MISFLTNNLIWTHGMYIMLGGLLLAGIGFVYSRFLFVVVLGFLAFSLFFFRNPDRIPPVGDNLILSPADGVVVAITQDNKDPDGFTQLISIFLSPFDVHVNRVPFAGQVHKIVYTPGAFTVAFLPKSSLLNEHNDIWFCDTKGRSIKVRQIAGFLARRICCWVRTDQIITPGERFGMIKFGSRVDIFLPDTVTIKLTVGQRVWAGQSVLGTW